METSSKNNISQVSSFIDEAFDPKRISDYQLFLQLNNDRILASVLDKQKNKYIAFEYYSFPLVFSTEQLPDVIEQAGLKSKIISHKYKKVSCLISDTPSTLVPDALFEEESKKSFLKFNTSLQGNELVLSNDILSLGAKSVFSVPFGIKAKLDSMFHSVSYHHVSSALLNALLSQTRSNNKKQLFVHIQPSSFQVILTEGKKLLFYNSFNQHSAEDFIYYLLFVCEQLSLNPETIDTTVLGEIEKTSAIYSVLQKYVRHIKFGERNDTADLSYQLQTFPRHFYFSLFNQSLA
jgi:hypothetical protein